MDGRIVMQNLTFGQAYGILVNLKKMPNAVSSVLYTIMLKLLEQDIYYPEKEA